MEKVKVKNVKTGVVKTINKAIAGDYVGMKDWTLFAEKEEKYAIKEEKSLEK